MLKCDLNFRIEIAYLGFLISQIVLNFSTIIETENKWVHVEVIFRKVCVCRKHTLNLSL